jgi:proliferating cell nuclear antigen
MRLTLAEPKYFKDSIAIISDLVTEARFKITKNAIELVAMDPANVAMVIFKLLSSTFTEYDVKHDVELAINLSNLKQIMRRASPNDMLTLEIADSRLKIQLKAQHTRTFSLPIIEMEDKEQKIPDLKFPVTIEMPCSSLNDAIDDADIVSDSVSFMVSDGKFDIEAEGDLNKAIIEIKEDENTVIKSERGEKYKAKYSIDYLKKMAQASKLAEKVKIHFNNDYPLKLEYVSVDKVQMVFILAPRVEND